jgi:phosphatidylserine decarboxylase
LFCFNSIVYPAMRIPLTKYGMPQVAIFPAIVVGIMVVALLLGLRFKTGAVTIIIIELLLVVVLGWVLAFFRDPLRVIPAGKDILLSPADGVVSDIEVIEDCPWIEGKVLRIGIFLNIFNVHINRVPCRVKIDGIEYKEGKFKNACDPESARVNEANAVLMTRLDEPTDKLVVRQISGAIARRIVCATKAGDEFKAGDQFGMIKFGSRTELYLPHSDSVKVEVAIGDKVRAGLDVFVRYEN